MNIPAESAVEIAKFHHEEWLKHPVTVQALRTLDSMRNKTVETIGAMAMSQSSDQEIRHLAISLKVYDNVEHVLSDTTLFVNNQLKGK